MTIDVPEFDKLGTRIQHALINAGYTSGEAVRQAMSTRLARIPGIGDIGVKQIRAHFPYRPTPPAPEPPPPDPVVERLDRVIVLLETIADRLRLDTFNSDES